MHEALSFAVSIPPSAGVAELVDAPDLGSGGDTPWEFESPRPHTDPSHSRNRCIVEYQRTQLADCEYELHIRISPTEAAPAIEAAYERARKDIAIEGFRKGRAPLELIKQRHGSQIEAEALEQLGQRLAEDLVRQYQWGLLSEPQLIDLQRSSDEIGFTFRLFTLPELTIELSGIVLQKPVRQISDDEVEAQLEQLRLQHGTAEEEVEEITDYYHDVRLHFQPVDADTGMPLVGTEAEELTVALYEPDVLPELRQHLLHARRNDSFLLTLPGSAEQGQPEQPPQTYRVTVRSIRRLHLAELSPEFAQRISRGRFHTVDELRHYIRQELQRQWDNHVHRLLRNQLEIELARRYPFTPPKPIVQRIARDLVESLQRGELHVPSEYARQGETGIYRFIAELADLYARLSILELVLLRQYQIQLTTDELQQLARTLNISPTELERQLREDPELAYDIRRRKLWQVLLQQVDVQPVPYTDDAH